MDRNWFAVSPPRCRISEHEETEHRITYALNFRKKKIRQLRYRSLYDVQVLPGIRRAGMQNLLATDGFIGVETPHSVFWTKRPDNDTQHMLDVFGTGQYGMKSDPVE